MEKIKQRPLETSTAQESNMFANGTVEVSAQE